MRRLLVFSAVLMLIPGVAFAGGGGVDTSGCAGYTEGTTVAMRDSCFAGTAHFAPSDTTITVSNDGQLPHTLTAVDGSFDTGNVDPGSSAELTVDEPGIYRVFCSLHGTADGQGMAGVVVVGEATPASVALPADTSAISDAVAAENASVLSAIQGQQDSIRGLSATEAKLLVALENLPAESGQSSSPQVIAVTQDLGPERLVVLVLVGLAAGLALAALAAVMRSRVFSGSSSKLDRLEPSVEP
jgi:plastocyanin